MVNVKNIEHCWIQVSDGTLLSARILMPCGAMESPVPAVLEYMPYRKRDHGRNRDEMMHGYFANHGYACVRVDTRGSGESEGVLTDEFTLQQTDDGVDIVNWIAEQPWCTGAVGMIGRSWSGFSALEVAARAPVPLKAIIPVCASLDRYRHGLHYAGGCFLTDNLHWTTTMLMLNMRPPDDTLVGAKAAAMWHDRLVGNVPWIGNWLKHQVDDEYYKEGSTVLDIEKFRCAVYYVGGWCDHFASAAVDGALKFKVPFRALIGPWAHHFGHDGEPGPRIGWLQDCVRWWDYWLKGIDNGASADPRLMAWIYEPAAPAPFHAVRDGRWVAERDWPSSQVIEKTLPLSDGRLGAVHSDDKILQHRSPLSVGMAAGGDWCRLGIVGEAPLDQREDDGRSLTFDSDPLEQRLEILGAPILHLRLSTNEASAQIAVRLNDISPDGTSSRVSYGFLNLTHRESHSNPEPLEPGHIYDVTIRLNDIGYAFPAGHRIRIAVSTSYWPYIWPSPRPVTVSVHTQGSSLTLPERQQPRHEIAVAFEPPESAPPTPITILEPAAIERRFSRNLLTGLRTLTLDYRGGYLGPGRLYQLDEIGVVLGHEKSHRCEINDDDPLSARYIVSQVYDMRRGTKSWRFTSEIVMWATVDRFFTEIDARATENGMEIWSRHWSDDYPRHLV